MLVRDLKKDYDTFEKSWIDCMSFIEKECQSDKLYRNYLNIDLERFLSLAIVMENDRIIAFGGAEINQSRWGESLSRVLSRFWISPDRRHQLVKINKEINFSPLILDINLKALRNHPQIKAAMITREGDGKHSFARIVEIANTVAQTPFKILDDRYNVCGNVDPIPKSCVQMIAMTMLDQQISLEQFLHNLENNTYFKIY